MNNHSIKLMVVLSLITFLSPLLMFGQTNPVLCFDWVTDIIYSTDGLEYIYFNEQDQILIHQSTYYPENITEVYFYNLDGILLNYCWLSDSEDPICDSVYDEILNNSEQIWVYEEFYPNCDCVSNPDFTFTYLYSSSNFSGQKFFEFENNTIGSYDSIKWWTTAYPEGFEEENKTIAYSAGYEEYEEEICMTVYSNMDGTVCDTTICKTAEIPCTNYTTFETSIEGGLLTVSTECDCNYNSYSIDYGDGTIQDIELIDWPTIISYSYSETGTFNVCLTVISEDIFNCEEILCNSIIVSEITGNNEILQNSNIEVYPNPFENYFSLNIGNTLPIQIKVFDSYGKIARIINKSSGSTYIDTSNWKSGLYVLEAKFDDKNYVEKIIKY